MFKQIKNLFINSNIDNNTTKQEINIRNIIQTKDSFKTLFDLPVNNSWIDDEAINKIMRDSTVIAAIANRKASTLKKEILITCEDENIKEILEDAFTFNTIDSILDIPYYGFGVYEINWELQKGIFAPMLVERDYKNFSLENNTLKFNNFGLNQSVSLHKVIAATYKAKPNKPYGQPLINTLFWLVEFKNASLEFWVELLERFGTPWIIAKTGGDKNVLASEIYNMLGGDGAIIDDEDNIQIQTAQNGGNFKELIEYIDNQIREVILGGNLTANVQSGSLAAANVHNDVREDLAQADENIVNQIIRELIWSFQQVNNINIQIKGKLKDKDDPNNDLAIRDKTIFDMGFKPTKEYIQATYNVEVNEFEHLNSNLILNNKPNNKPIILSNIAQDELEVNLNSIDFTPLALTFYKQITKIVEQSNSYEQMLDNLFKAYPTFDTKDLEQSLYQYLANSSILAIAKVEDENPNG